MREGDDS